MIYSVILRINEKTPKQQQQPGECDPIKKSGVRISLFSLLSLVALFAIYGYFIPQSNLVLSSRSIQLISDIGVAVFVLLLITLFGIGHGIYRICQSKKMRISKVGIRDQNQSIIALLPSIVLNIISQKRYRELFLVVFFAYAILFSLISQILIFRPDVSFSHIYGVTIPSWKITACCNMPGLVPSFTAYLSDNLIIFIIPINLVLAVVVSTLVSVNMTVALYAFQKGRSKKGIKNGTCFSGIGGAMTGFFTACPLCAGSFFSTTVGIVTGLSGSSTLVTSVLLSPLQPLFIAISITLLLISPYITIRNLIIRNQIFSNI
jgi:hypothetical protein